MISNAIVLQVVVKTEFAYVEIELAIVLKEFHKILLLGYRFRQKKETRISSHLYYRTPTGFCQPFLSFFLINLPFSRYRVRFDCVSLAFD